MVGLHLLDDSPKNGLTFRASPRSAVEEPVFVANVLGIQLQLFWITPPKGVMETRTRLLEPLSLYVSITTDWRFVVMAWACDMAVVDNVIEAGFTLVSCRC